MTSDTRTPVSTDIRSRFKAQRAARQARNGLRADLAHYNRPADRLELLTIMERYSSKETAPIRAILSEQSVTR